MIKTPLLNTKLVQHMDVPMIPDVLMLNAGESLEGALFRRGDLLDALSVDIYFKDVESRLHNVFDVVTTKLRNHISDTYCHTNPDEKRYWNNKLDKSDFDSAFAVLKSRLDGYEGSLDDIRSILNSLPDFDLYALKTDLKDFITGDDLEDILKNIGLIDEDGAPIIDVDTITNIINNADLSNYVKKGSILGTINGIEFREGSSITISGGTSPSGDLYLTANDLKTINGQSIVGTGNIVIDGGGSGDGSSSDTFITNVTNVLKDNLKYETAVQKTDSGAYKLGTVMVEVPNNTGYETLFEIWGHDLRGSGGGGGTDPTDISDLEDLILDINTRIQQIIDELGGIHSDDLESISETVLSILGEWNEFKQNPGELWGLSNFGTSATQYIQQVINTNADGNGGTWSSLIQKFDTIEAKVDAIQINPDGSAAISEATIKTWIELDVAQTLSQSNYVLLENDSEDAEILNWWLAKFHTKADKNGALAEMVVDSMDGSMSVIRGNITTLNGEVTEVRTFLTSMFDTDTLSGVDTIALLDEAIARLFAKSGQHTAAITALTDSEGAIASMIVKNEEDAASIVAKINNAESSVIIKADKIDLNGYLTAGNAEFDGKVHATEFAAGDSGSANMAINGENIEFYFGNERRAYFSQGEDNRGMQLHIMNTDGTWYIIDFTSGTWSSDGGGSTQYAYYSPATLSNLHVMQSTPLYYKNGIYYTDTQLTNRANKTYYTQAEVYNRDGEGEALYGVVSDSNNEIHVAAYVKNLIRYESVEFSNGAIVSSQTKYIYTGRAPKQLVLKADGTPSNINYDNVDTMLVSVESNVNTQWLYNGYTNGIVSDTNTIINPVISGTYAQISNAGFSEYEVLDLGSQFAPQLIFIDEDDELTW